MINSKRASGFTIVELLIVVVVIAVLASIAIVSYVGIQDKARNTNFLMAMDAYEKSLRMHHAENGTYPSTDVGGQSYVPVCLGNYPALPGFSESNCMADSFNPSAQNGGVVNPAVNQALLKYISALPDVSSMVFSINGGPYYRGILYTGGGNSSQATLSYYTNSDQPCGRGLKSLGTDPSGKPFTKCDIILTGN